MKLSSARAKSPLAVLLALLALALFFIVVLLYLSAGVHI